VIVPLVLSALIARCAPGVGPVTMSAVVVHESGAHPYAIGDNTARRSYFPHDAFAATRLARTLLAAGHNVDLGYAQINSSNLAPYGLDVARALEPCTNVATGSRILRAAYAGARSHFGAGQVALEHALSAYNSGGYYAGMSYARGVYATAAGLRYERGSVTGSFFGSASGRGRAVAFHRAAHAAVVTK
jgi:type IV secretion system protein VirB1